MFANRVFTIEIDGLDHGGTPVDADPFDIDFDGTVIEIVATVSQPGDIAQANGTSGNAKRLYEMVDVKLELVGTAKGGTLPITDGEFVNVRAVGGSSELPGKEWRIQVSRNAKLRVSAANSSTNATPTLDGLRLKLDFRAYDPSFPKVEATA